jgi:gliding motility-associatede transport system auxiliary component
MIKISKKTKGLFFSGIGIIIVAAIVVLINSISNFVYYRVDLTQGKIFSISKATKKIVAGLEDPVIIKLFYSKELPPQVKVYKNYVVDLLKEYENASKGKVNISFVNVDQNEPNREEARSEGILPMRFDVFSKDKYEQSEGFLGLVIKYRDKREAMPFINDTSSLEYDLTSKVKMLVSQKKEPLGIVISHGCDSPITNMLIARTLTDKYDLREIDLEKDIPADVKNLIMVSPKGNLGQKNIEKLENYLKKGNSLFLSVDTVDINPQNFRAIQKNTDMDKFLDLYGLSLTSGLVMDMQSQPIQITSQNGGYQMSNIIQYPPLVISNKLNRKNPATKDIDSVIFPFSAGIVVSSESAKTATVMASSSKLSWLNEIKNKQVSLDPSTDMNIKTGIKGPFNLAVLISGDNDSRLFVNATSHFISQDYQPPNSNYLFFLNIVDWLGQDTDLISIRSKSAAFHPLREISDSSRRTVKYVNMFLPSLFAVMLGLLLWKLKNRNRKLNVSKYSN